MSLFLFQQKIPFASVINYLRVFEPGCNLTPEGWSKKHAEDVAIGDLLFFFEPIYSPWGDSSSGIGVAEGDSFSVVTVAIVHKWEKELQCYAIGVESYERQSLQVLLAQKAHEAKNAGGGFYYAIARANTPLPPDVVRDLGELDSFGNSGWRQEEGHALDLIYSYLKATGWEIPIVEQAPDIAQIGYGFFCDKEPAAGTNVPDIRAFMHAVYKDKKKTQEAVPDLGKPEEGPVEPPKPQSNIPRMPSFFTKQNKGDVKTGQQPVLQNIHAAWGSDVPTQTFQTLGPEEGAPQPKWAQQDIVTEQFPAYRPDMEMSGPTPPPLVPVQPPPLVPVEEAGALTPVSDPPPLMAAAPPPLPALDAPAPPPLPGAPAPPPLPAAAAPPPLPVAHSAQPAPPPLPSAPHAMPNIDFGEPEPEVTAVEEEPQSAPEESPAELPVEEPPALVPEEQPPEIVPQQEPPQLVPEEQPPELVPPAVPPEIVPAEQPPTITSIKDHHAQSAAEQPQAAEPPSLSELLGNIGRAAEVPEAPRQRPGRQAPPPPVPQPKVVEPAPEPEVVQPVAEGSEGPSIDFSQIGPLPPKKKKQEEPARVKEQIQVKSGVAGLVSKLEQQASKASTRLEQQVDDIQARLSEELSQIVSKIVSAENRNVRNAHDLRAGLTERLDDATKEVIAKIADSAKEGTGSVRKHEDDGSAQLDEKHEFVQRSLTNSFNEVRDRAETIAKSFEETLNTLSADALKQVDELRDNVIERVDKLHDHYQSSLQGAYDSFKERLENANQSITTTVEGRYSLLQGQLAELNKRSVSQLEHLRHMLVNQLSKQFAVAQADVLRLKASALEETVMPRLKQHREELRVITTEFQHKLASDLDSKCEEKLADLDPVLEEKKQKLMALLQETAQVKASIEEQLRQRLEGVSSDLKSFVDKNVETVQTAYKQTEEQLAEIDRAVRALADPSSIEGDLELLNERNECLSKMDEATETAKEEVLSTLRSSLASLEEKGKQLQEELISSMEEDAYRVRRASEQALHAIRETVRESFVAIQNAQDERMPM